MQVAGHACRIEGYANREVDRFASLFHYDQHQIVEDWIGSKDSAFVLMMRKIDFIPFGDYTGWVFNLKLYFNRRTLRSNKTLFSVNIFPISVQIEWYSRFEFSWLATAALEFWEQKYFRYKKLHMWKEIDITFKPIK